MLDDWSILVYIYTIATTTREPEMLDRVYLEERAEDARLTAIEVRRKSMFQRAVDDSIHNESSIRAAKERIADEYGDVLGDLAYKLFMANPNPNKFPMDSPEYNTVMAMADIFDFIAQARLDDGEFDD